MGQIILKWIFNKQDGRVCHGLMWFSGNRPVAGSFEHGNEPHRCQKYREHLDYLRNYKLLKFSEQILLQRII
jgi:hypothetical protein